MSEHAETAKAIRKELKKHFPNTKFKVNSECFSMGNSVHISWIDGETDEEINNIVKIYQYGHFDGMVDLYEYSNKRENIPQVKYVQTQRSLSEETIKEFIKAHNSIYSDKIPLNPSSDFEYNDEYMNGYQLAWRFLSSVNLNKISVVEALKQELKIPVATALKKKEKWK